MAADQSLELCDCSLVHLILHYHTSKMEEVNVTWFVVTCLHWRPEWRPEWRNKTDVTMTPLTIKPLPQVVIDKLLANEHMSVYRS